MVSRVQKADFDLRSEVESLVGGRRDVGAICSFIGLVRESNVGRQVEALELEHHEQMSEVILSDLELRLRERYDVQDVLLLHRYGRLSLGEQIVLVVVLSAHRVDAFRCASEAMEEMKTAIPFWKKEYYSDGSFAWLTPDDSS